MSLPSLVLASPCVSVVRQVAASSVVTHRSSAVIPFRRLSFVAVPPDRDPMPAQAFRTLYTTDSNSRVAWGSAPHSEQPSCLPHAPPVATMDGLTFRISCGGGSGSEPSNYSNDCQPAVRIPLVAKLPSPFCGGWAFCDLPDSTLFALILLFTYPSRRLRASSAAS
jgi:hypothetical protein